MPTKLVVTQDAKDTQLVGVPFMCGLGDHPQYQAALDEARAATLVAAEGIALDDPDSIAMIFTRLSAELQNRFQPVADASLESTKPLEFFRIFQRDIVPVVNSRIANNETAPFKAVLHFWHCPKQWDGLFSGNGTSSIFFKAFDAAVNEEHGRDPDFPIALGWDVVFACMNAPELDGHMLNVIIAFTDCVIRFLRDVGLFTFAADAVVHGDVPHLVAQRLPDGVRPQVIAHVRHMAFWRYRSNEVHSSSMAVAVNIIAHLIAATGEPIGGHWHQVVRVYNKVYDLIKAQRSVGKLLSALRPFDAIAAQLLASIAHDHPAQTLERIVTLEAQVAEECPRHREALLRTVDDKEDKIAELEETVEKLKDDLEEVRRAALPPLKTGRERMCSCGGDTDDNIVLCCIHFCLYGFWHRQCAGLPPAEGDVAPSPSSIYWVCPDCIAKAKDANIDLTPRPLDAEG
ncbi:hypothetical protein OC844_006237 [Tilletia horrida]|nr:hypothetical protein OC844_006237 [Tilletia horrida]